MSKKNIKNNKKNSNRKNYKIEALEPRLMMDANVGLDDFENQIDSISTAVDSCVSSISDFNLSSFGLDSSLDSASQFLTGASDAIKDQVKGIFEDYRSSLDSKVKSVDIDDLVLALNEKIGTLPSSITDLSFVKEGKDTIKVNFKYQGQPVETDKFVVSNVGLNIDGEKFSVAATADMSVSLDLDKNDDDKFLNDGLGDAADDIDFTASVNNISASVPNVGVSASFMNVSVHEEDDSKTDLEVSYAAGSTSSNVDLEFSLDTTSSNMPFELVPGKFIEITKSSGNSQFEVDFPEVYLKKSVSALLGSIETEKLPFLNEFIIPFFDENGNIQNYTLAQIPNLVKAFDEYWARASLALNGIVDADKMKFDNLQNFFGILVEKKLTTVKKLFDSIKVYGPDSTTDFAMIFANTGSTSVTNSLTELTLGDKDNKKTLTLEFSPNLGCFSDEIDFKLFKLKDFNLSASLKIDVNVWLDNEGKLCFDEISLNDFTIKMSKSVDAELQLGLFKSDLKGNLTYTISANATGLKDSTLVLHCDTANLKSGSVEIAKESDCDFTFNMVESVWEFPEKFKQYFALTGETLANNVGIYLNSLRTSLRDLIEDKIKLDFLGDSAGSLVADTIAKIDEVLYGKTNEKNVNNNAGLFKVDQGALVANFESVEGFVSQFNIAWNSAFGKTGTQHSILKYADKKGALKTVKDFDLLSEKEKQAFDFDHYVIEFNLVLDILKTLDLNFVDTFGTKFANVSTYGAVTANGKAGITFSLDVNFSHEKINDNNKKTTLQDFWGLSKNEHLPKNETYFEADVRDVFSGNTKFEVVEGKSSVIDYVTPDSSASSAKIDNSVVKYFREDDQVIITRDNAEFNLQSSENQQAYAELGLGGSSLQTTTIANIDGVDTWSSDLTLYFVSKDGNENKSLKIAHDVLNQLVQKNIINSVEKDDAALKDLLNQYFNIQYSKEYSDILDMKDSNGEDAVLVGRTIMNTFGLYVVSVAKQSGSGYTVRFGCDPSRIQGNGESELKESLQFNLKSGSSVVFMRVSNKLKRTGVIGSENYLALEKYSLDTYGDLKSKTEYIDLSSITGINYENSYTKTELATAKSALENALKTLGFGEYEVNEYDAGENAKKEKLYSLGVSATDYSTFIYRAVVDATDPQKIGLEKYRIEDGCLVFVETKSIGCDTSKEYTTAEEIEDANEYVSKLNTALKNLYGEAFEAKLNDETHKIEITPKQSDYYRAVLSNKFLKISITPQGDTEPSVIRLNTENCRDLTSLAHAVISAAENAKIACLNSVAVQGDKIVFGVEKGTAVEWSYRGNSLADAGSDDFEVGHQKVDFETLNMSDGNGGTVSVDKTWTLDDVVKLINDELNGSGVSLEYFDIDNLGNNVYWDHLEFRSTSDFELKNLGSSVILDKLGFTAKKATKYADNDFRIIGKALLGVDWSKLIDFTAGADLNVYANASLDLGQKFKAVSPIMMDGKGNVYSDPKDFDKADRIVFESDSSLNFVVNGLVKAANGNYYKILDVEKLENPDPSDASKIIVTIKVTLSKFAEGNKQELTSTYINFDTSATSKNPTNVLCYMGGAVATVGFVDVNLVASGSVSFDASFDLKKLGLNEKVSDPNNAVQGYEIENPDASILGATGSAEFSIDAFVDIGDTISEKLGSANIALGEDGKLDVGSNLDGIVKKAIDTFGNFSVEDLFAVLDSLVERLCDVAKKSNVKIPVINKSVSDLVDVANNIRDIVTKLRSDKIFSLQGLNARLNKYLKDFGLIAHDGAGALLEKANPFLMEIVDNVDTHEKELLFTFNIDKAFDTVHQFSFGDDKKGISGNANLKVTGDFWFSMTGKTVIGDGTFDLSLEKAIEFGASVDIVGEKLSFNLGLDNITDVDLLANLITVGSNKSDSYVCAKASLMGSFGNDRISLKTFNPDKVDFTFAVPIVLMGRLPISVCNMPLGDVLLGIGSGNELSVKKNADDAKSGFNAILLDYADYWKNKNDGDSSNDVEKPAGLIDFESINAEDFFELVTESDYSKTNGKIVADFSDVYEGISDLINADLSWFEKIKLAITGFNKLFDTLEASLNGGMMSSVKDVPVVGNALSGGVDFLGNLKRKVLEPLSNFLYESTGMNAEMVAQKLNELFGTYLRAVDIDPRGLSEAWQPSATTDKQTFFREGKNAEGKKYAEWYLSIGDKYTFGNDIGFDLGFPGLGLKSDAGVNLSLGWSLDFGFGVSEDGFYFIFNDGNEVQVEASVEINGNIMGSLAGLGLKMEFDKGSKPVTLGFGIDLDSDKRTFDEYGNPVPVKHGKTLLDYSKFSLGNIDFNYEADVNISPTITVGIVSDLDNKVGDAPKFPNLIGTFDFQWNAKKGVTALSFNNFQLDMGTFISGVLGPIVSKIQKVVEPLEPLIDFLTTPFPVLDDLGFTYTPLSLAKQFSKGKFDDRMVYAVKDLIEISKKISAFGGKELKIDIGSMELFKAGAISANEISESLLSGSLPVSNFDVTSGYANVSSGVQGKASSSLMSAGLNMGDSAWRFVWDNPSDLFKLLLGQDIMLVEYDMPKLSFNFDWSTFVRIYGPLGARIGLSLGADINLGFGYDTLGIRQWIGTSCKDFGCLLNGFYVNDLRDGVDIDELSFHGALTAAAELNAGVSAGVGGGVGINVGFNLYDPNKDGKIRLGEMTQMFKEDGLFGFFDINGKITAKLYAYVDLLFYTKEWNITGDKTLFEFKNERKSLPVMISKSGDDVVANIGTNAANRISTNGVNKTLSDDDEILYLKVNGDKVLDDYGHSEEVKEKLIINAEKGNDKIYIKLDDDAKAADFDIIINGGDGNDIIDLSGLKVAAGHYVLITGGAGADNIIGAQGLNIIFGDAYVTAPTVKWDENDKTTLSHLIAEAGVNAKNSGGDVILGGSAQDIIFGGAGDDEIDGADGNDFIFGDGGRVEFDNSKSEGQKWTIDRTDISLDGGKDILIGGAGEDVIYGGGGDDHIDGGAGKDTIYGERGHDRILGGSGDDTIYGGEGMDIVFGDRITGSKDVAAPFAVDKNHNTAAFSQEFIEAHFKSSTLVKADDFEIKHKDVVSNLDKDALTNLSEDDLEYGNDTIYGEDGNDLLFGDDGDDTKTDAGQDKIYGGIGNDVIDGDAGNDTIEGGIDNDIIYGGVGDDFIDGGAGNDSIYGDNGVTDYKKANDDVDAKKLVNKGADEDKVVFGDNLGLHGVLYANAKSESKGGSDKIKTGPGMDFVDGQGGSDIVTVKMMGDSTTNYANITDSGTEGADTLVVEGTESVDRLLLRQNAQQELGLVALLPMEEDLLDDDSKKDVSVTSNLNSNIERVNYTAGIETLNVNANGGNDQIYIDGTAHKTNVDGGAGHDNFYIGQIYNSERNSNDSAAVQPIDNFNTQKTNEEGYLSDGVTAGTVLNIEGGSGEDNFIALNNVGTVSLSGGKGNDTFSMYSFRKDGSGDAFERGAVLIDGGKGDDTLKVRGTDNDDVFVVTKEGMLSDLIAIKASGVESSQFDAAAGDDMFHVVANKAEDMTELYGGKGNDTFSMGGLDQPKTLRSANTDGQSVNVKYEFLTDEGLTDEQKAELDQSLIDDLKSNGAIDENFTVVDSDTEAAVFIVENIGTDAQPEYKILESAEIFLEKEFGSESDVASFFVGCAGIESGKSLDVTISAPVLSTMDSNRGDRGFQVSSDGVKWDTTVTVHPTAGQPAKVYVRALADALVEEGVRKSIAITSELVESATSKKVLTKSVNSVGLVFKGEDRTKAATSLNKYPLVCTEEFIIGSNKSFKVNAIPEKGFDASKAELSFYVNGEKQSWTYATDYTITEGVVTIIKSVSLPADGTLAINVHSKTMRVDDSRVSLAYEDPSISVTLDGEVVSCEYTTGCKLFYKLNGNVITFYNGTTKQPMTVHGNVTVDASLPSGYIWEQFGSVAAATPLVTTRGLLQVDAHESALVETNGSSFNSVSYDISFLGTIADEKKVFVKISPTELLANSGADEKSQRLSISCDDFETLDDGSIVLSFDKTTLVRTITVSAVADGELDDYGLTEVPRQDERIENIDGPVYAYGYGETMNLDTGNPAMLSYKHVVENSQSGQKPIQASNYNELNNFEKEKLLEIDSLNGTLAIKLSSVKDGQKAALSAVGIEWSDDLSTPEAKSKFLAQFEHKTFKWVNESVHNFGTRKDPVYKTVSEVATTWARIEFATIESDLQNPSELYLVFSFNENVDLPSGGKNYALISGNKDSIFVDEMASVDRLFVNNQKSDVGASSSLDQFVANNSNDAEGKVDKYDIHAVRFTHDELASKNGVTAAQMEYAEYNLGTGKDTVDVNKTIYREDAYRTFTVVNTGNAKNSKAAFGTSIGNSTISSENLTNGARYFAGADVYKYDLIPAEGSEIDVNKTTANTTIFYVQAEIRKLNSDSEKGYDVVAYQRREVLGSFSSAIGFYIKYDFILAEGEYIGGFEFFQAEFDDYIRVNSYKADAPFVNQDDSTKNGVICTGTIPVTAPVEETPVTPTDDSDAEESNVEGAVASVTEESSASEEVAGIEYRYTIDSAYSGTFATNKANYEAAKNMAVEPAANGYAFGLFVDATMSDGSVQRRFVSELTENTFKVTRDFTLTVGVTIVSFKFAYGYEGDGQLVVNAQSGHDRIDASSSDVTRNDMVVFGGFGDDYITMNKGGIAFGDRGQVTYENGKVNGVDVGRTVLGSTDGDGDRNGGLDYTTGISKNHGDDTEANGPEHRLQTDGVNRDAKEIRSMDDSNLENGIDLINVGGTNSVVIGGDKADVIVISGDKNVALGDNGRVEYNNATNNDAVYGDQLGLGMHIVETTTDYVGDVDNIVIAGNKNVAMGGDKGDSIRITGADNVAIGDAGRYTIERDRLYAESKKESDHIGGQDYISTGDGKNAVIGGTDSDTIRTGAGNDAIIGDGGIVIMDTDRNMLMVSNEGRNIATVDKDEKQYTYEDGSAGIDDINAGDGDNVVFGGLNNDDITTGKGKDVVFGDNGYATFRGNANEAWYKGYDESRPNVHDIESTPTIYEESTVSFNFQGDAQNGLGAGDSAGAPGYESENWINIRGTLASTYGNDDSEVVRFDNGTRASALSLSFQGNEDPRYSSTDNAINLQSYNHWLWNRDQDNDAKLMNSGLMATAPNDQNGSKMNVAVDGLAQYYESYKVVVYLDLPDANSWYNQSVRKVTIKSGDYSYSYYINDYAGKNFNGEYKQSTFTSVDDIIKAVQKNAEIEAKIARGEPLGADDVFVETFGNYVVFDVSAEFAADRIEITVEDGITDTNRNGKDVPGIAAIQIKGVHHKQDIAATTDINFGGEDEIHSGRGDDIVVGGTNADHIDTFGDDRLGIEDNDVVYGDNAKMVFVDRDGNDETASTISSAESIAVKNTNMSYDDTIDTGDGNDTVVGGIGHDIIHTGATAAAEEMYDGVKALSINFTREDADKSLKIGEATYVTYTNEEIKSPDLILGTHYVVDGRGNNIAIDENGKKIIAANGETAGIVADYDWHNMYVKNHELHELVDFSSHTVDGVDVTISAYANAWEESIGKNSSMTHEISDELDGDTSNSKLYHGYLAAQKQEEIKLTLNNLDTFRKHNGLADGTDCDLYVYLGGDNNDVHTYDHIYEISLTWYDTVTNKTVTDVRYLNDWTGYNFDGDYKEAKCKSRDEAIDLLHKDSAVRVEIIGNYVVFHGIEGQKAEIRIKNIYTHGSQNANENGEQNPKNLPLITAVQIVAGSDKKKAAIGGDHDKDLVFGDDAKLTFDFDVPYAVDEKINDYRNRVVDAESMAIANKDVTRISTEDEIDTGKDRDIVVGGEGHDKISTGSGDDIAIGGSANLMVEHNNPLGVFTPSVEIVLDQHTINTNIHQGYLDRHCSNEWEAASVVSQYQSKLDQGQITGIQIIDNQNDRFDEIDTGDGRNLYSWGNQDNSELVVPKQDDPIDNPEEQEQGGTSGEHQEDDLVQQYVLDSKNTNYNISIKAGQTITLILTEWEEGNPWYHPNVGLQVDVDGNAQPILVFNWNNLVENNGVVTLEPSGSQPVRIVNNSVFVDIPDSANVVGEKKIVLMITSEEDLDFRARISNRG